MASPHSDIPQCINSNEPERISQSEQQLPSPHCHIQMSSPLTIIQYPSEIKTESAKKNYKQKLLSNNPETLFADLFKTGEICNLIFFSDHPSAWHKAIIKHYPSVKKEGVCNGWKVKIREPQDPDDTMITVNIYKNGTVMVQGNLKFFQADYRAIAEAMKHKKALLSESLSSEQNPQNSSSDLRSTHTETAKTENIPSSLLKSIPILQEHFMKLEMEMVQLRETMLKQQQSHTRAAHTELQQNTEHQTQRLTALTQQMRTLQMEKDSYQCELTSLRLQLQDREQSTLEMRQQLREIQEEREQQNSEIQALKEQMREIQEEREQQNSEIQALKEQMRELLLAREETAQTHRAQTLPSTPKPPNTGSQHPPLGADSERLDPDSSQPSQSPLSGSPVQQHQPSSHSSPAQTSTEKPEVALLIDSNGKFIDIKKLFPRHRAVKFWCPTTDKALELLTKSQLGQPSHIIIHTGTNDLRSQQDRVSDSLRAVVEKARETFPNSKITLSTLLQRKDFHPKTINKINSSISRHCALLPNVHLAHHPDLDTDCLYDHVHLYKNLVHIFANSTRHASGNYITANTSSRAPPRPSAPRASPPRGPHRAPASRADLYGQRLSYNSPNAPAAEARPQQSPVQTDYTQAVSGGVSRANTELHEIQHMLSIICSHLLTHSGQW
ncbi:hypothetical protein QQF64_028840 [Cirrhinus molitorella]|uniref:Uncharacterized protein n=1 Tax=Cirrhinus molitorella TaxID=172907 RepID=A0ABR3N840_9TELE